MLQRVHDKYARLHNTPTATGGGGDPSVLDANYPPTNCWPEAPGGGCEGGVQGGRMGGGIGKAGGRGVREGRLGGVQVGQFGVVVGGAWPGISAPVRHRA